MDKYCLTEVLNGVASSLHIVLGQFHITFDCYLYYMNKVFV